MMRITVLAIGAVALAGSALARPVHYAAPADSVPAALADADGQAVAGQCATCHSLDYITTQPRGKGAQFWRDEVAKMVNVYKAPVAPADADTVAAVLGKKFG